MSYKLEKPCTNIQRADFVVEHNHTHGRIVEETETALYALEANEMLLNGVPAINPNYEAERTAKENAMRALEIKRELDALDLKSIRAIREGGADDDGILFTVKYQEQIAALRTELETISV